MTSLLAIRGLHDVHDNGHGITPDGLRPTSGIFILPSQINSDDILATFAAATYFTFRSKERINPLDPSQDTIGNGRSHGGRFHFCVWAVDDLENSSLRALRRYEVLHDSYRGLTAPYAKFDSLNFQSSHLCDFIITLHKNEEVGILDSASLPILFLRGVLPDLREVSAGMAIPRVAAKCLEVAHLARAAFSKISQLPLNGGNCA